MSEEMESIVQDYSVTYAIALELQSGGNVAVQYTWNIMNNGKALEVPNTVEQIRQQNRDIGIVSVNESRVT